MGERRQDPVPHYGAGNYTARSYVYEAAQRRYFYEDDTRIPLPERYQDSSGSHSRPGGPRVPAFGSTSSSRVYVQCGIHDPRVD